jgi:hypothetical protein
MIRCSECDHKLYKENKYMNWLSLMNFVDFLLLEEYINKETAESMTDRLMDFKEYALDESDLD